MIEIRWRLLRAVLSLAGFAAALLAVAAEHRPLGWLAIALLAASLIVRIVRRGSDGRLTSSTCRKDDAP